MMNLENLQRQKLCIGDFNSISNNEDENMIYLKQRDIQNHTDKKRETYKHLIT